MLNDISEITFCLQLMKKQKMFLMVFFMNYSKKYQEKIAVYIRGSDFIFDYVDKALLLQ